MSFCTLERFYQVNLDNHLMNVYTKRRQYILFLFYTFNHSLTFSSNIYLSCVFVVYVSVSLNCTLLIPIKK